MSFVVEHHERMNSKSSAETALYGLSRVPNWWVVPCWTIVPPLLTASWRTATSSGESFRVSSLGVPLFSVPLGSTYLGTTAIWKGTFSLWR